MLLKRLVSGKLHFGDGADGEMGWNERISRSNYSNTTFSTHIKEKKHLEVSYSSPTRDLQILAATSAMASTSSASQGLGYEC